MHYPLLPRRLCETVREHLAAFPAVAILGPRLCTSLVSLAIVTCVTATAVAVAAGDGRTTSSPQVRVDPRVELVSIIFRLAGNPEYNQGRVPRYTRDVDAHFGPYRNHRVVALATRLRRTRGVSYDACMSMAVHMPDGPATTTGGTAPFTPRSHTLDDRWREAEAREFVDSAHQFAKESSFAEFFDQHKPLYKTATSRMQKVLAQSGHLDWFDAFFGQRPQARFTVVLGMLNGGACYGPRCGNASGGVDLYCVLGVWKTDLAGLPVFDTSMLRTVVHEFCHSYTNAIVDRHQEQLRAAGNQIYPYVESAMRRQAYGNWKTMMYESLVRACVVRYVRHYEGRQAAADEVRRQAQRGFTWVGGLSARLGEYEAEREKYRDLDSFMPRIVAYFDAYAKVFVASQQKLADNRPHVVSMTPSADATEVRPGLGKIRVVFDRPMQNGSWSLVGGGPHFPKVVGKPSYDQKCVVWTVPMELQPNWSYQFMLNSDRFTGFRSREGVPLEPVRGSFATGDAGRRPAGGARTDRDRPEPRSP
jgi:hypothetical protein